MHGLINRSIQSYVCCRFGGTIWEDVIRHAGFEFNEFEAMLTTATTKAQEEATKQAAVADAASVPLA